MCIKNVIFLVENNLVILFVHLSFVQWNTGLFWESFNGIYLFYEIITSQHWLGDQISLSHGSKSFKKISTVWLFYMAQICKCKEEIVDWRVICSYLSLTHVPLVKMATISQTTFLNVFSWMKKFVFFFKVHWGLFLRVQLTITQHWCIDLARNGNSMCAN